MLFGMAGVVVGGEAPDFSLQAQDGSVVRLRELRGRRVVLFFYPKDGSPGCTRENCMIRDRMGEFKALNAVVLGISRDSAEKHKAFASRHGFAHLLLSDPGGKVCRAYGALSLLGLAVKRRTVVIDENGVVRRIIDSIMPGKHVEEAIKTLKEL